MEDPSRKDTSSFCYLGCQHLIYLLKIPPLKIPAPVPNSEIIINKEKVTTISGLSYIDINNIISGRFYVLVKHKIGCNAPLLFQNDLPKRLPLFNYHIVHIM